MIVLASGNIAAHQLLEDRFWIGNRMSCWEPLTELRGSFSRDEQNHVAEFSSENQRFSAHLLRRHFLTQAAGQVDSGAWLGQQYTGLVFASLDKFYLIARLQDALVSSIIILHEDVSPSPYPFCFLYPKRDITCHNQCRFSRKGPIPRATFWGFGASRLCQLT